MELQKSRRDFIKTAAIAGAGLGFLGQPYLSFAGMPIQKGKRVGIIGLDTSHSIAFTKALNAEKPEAALKGYKVVAAYPYGSKTIESSFKRIAGYTEDMKKLGVEIVDSIAALLKKVDVVMLETNDGRLHLEQALPVLKAGKRLFIDKPIAASLKDTKAIFDASIKYKTPLFSSSSLRYAENLASMRDGSLLGKLTGADTFSPASLESTHPDLLWYGIHGVEMLFTILGVGCESVVRVHHPDTDVVVGTWADGRIGTYRGLRAGKVGYGGTAFGEKGIATVGKYNGYTPLLYEVINFFDTGIVPIAPEETTEIVAFIEAADESKRQNGIPVKISDIKKRAGI